MGLTFPGIRRRLESSRGAGTYVGLRGYNRVVKSLAFIAVLFLATGLSAIPLQIEAPVEMNPVRAQIEAIDPETFRPLLDLTGGGEVQEPVRIVLAPEGSPIATSAPPWVAGWAYGSDGLAVLIPSRARRYPDGGVDELLRHELSHVLVARKVRGGEIPRWFDEGLALFGSRGWQLEDRSRLAFAMVRGEQTSLSQLDRLFTGSEGEMARAYAISGAFVRELILRHGREVTGEILRGVGEGKPFGESFAGATGESLAVAEASFWKTQTLWSRWVPFITSTLALWLFITFLALWAIRRRRRANRMRVDAWEDQEE